MSSTPYQLPTSQYVQSPLVPYRNPIAQADGHYDAQRYAWKQAYLTEIKNNPDVMGAEFATLYHSGKAIKRIRRQKAYLITITPNHDNYDRLNKVLTKWGSRTDVLDSLWCYEWKQNGMLHVHMACRMAYGIGPCTILKWALSTFRKHVESPQDIDVSGMPEEQAFTYAMKSRPKDVSRRDDLNLKPYYTCSKNLHELDRKIAKNFVPKK